MRTFIVFIVLSFFTITEVAADDSLWIKRHTLMLNKPCPSFSKKDLNNKPWSNKTLLGKVTLVSCWKIGCIPCMDEAPHLKAFTDTLTRQGLQVISFARNNKEILTTMLRDTCKDKDLLWYKKAYSGLNFPIIPCCKNPELEKWDRTDCLFLEKELKILGYPTILLVDKKGIIRYMHVGFSGAMSKNEAEQVKTREHIATYFAILNAEIDKLLAE
jgi:thiol-disulfide isomerase/thioredoxin